VDRAYGHIDTTKAQGWAPLRCPVCDSGMAVLGVTVPDFEPPVAWMRCAQCRRGFVDNNGTVSPAGAPLSNPEGVTGRELRAWQEVRD